MSFPRLAAGFRTQGKIGSPIIPRPISNEEAAINPDKAAEAERKAAHYGLFPYHKRQMAPNLTYFGTSD